MSIALPASIRTRFIAWSALMLALLGVFAWRVLPHLKVETDILALLPQTQQDRDLDAALQAFSAELARKQIFLIGSDRLADAKVAAAGFARELQASGAFESVQLELDADLQQRAAVYLAHRAFLLSPQDRQVLTDGNTDSLLKRALRAAYTPTGLMQPLSLAQDPLGFTNNFLRAQTPVSGKARLEGSTLVVEHEGRSYVLVLTENEGSPFASSVQEQVMPAIAQAKLTASRAVQAPVEIVSSGAIQHAAAAAKRAEHEISTFGTIESIAVVLLLLLVFGAMRPLLLGVLTLSLAVVAAFTVVHFVFGEVHLLALVFGSSLIGSVIDYSIHFFADRFRDPARWTPVEAAQHVGPAILLGLTTTLIGYVVLAIVPFPGLKQIAVFCMVGLVVGCGSVLCLYPVLAQTKRKRLPRLGTRLGGALDRFLQRWRWTTPKFAVLAVLAIGVAFGIARLQVQDDVKALQQSPAELVRDEQRVRELLGSGIETRFFLVSGDSAQAVLEAEERLSQVLDRFVADRTIASYQSVSNSLSSQARQQRNRELLAQQVYAPGALFDQVMNAFGFSAAAMERRRTEFDAATTPLGVEEWLNSSASQGLRHLWLGQVGARYASIVTLGGINDVPALAALELPGVRLIDRVAETSGILSRYRHTMTLLLAVIYAVAGAVLLIRFGWRDAPRMLLPSVAATLTTLGLFGWLGVPFNLFTLLALWLVLGLGIDYGIFLRHGRDHRPTAILSVTLSACTTLIAFGLLGLSATPFIRTIGLTLLCAITLSWSFVLLSCLTRFTSRAAREEKAIP
ncbi:MAG TPA: MMPL family transporter [Povalibacter sp.]|uniref:MMPL family transporter n=1 Tax=Povalibacter sp. TaxID=1962978 RepID=UPI002B5CF111|nr:MMPL family transporter [Povalibacter sp.]HMN44777.1 MMPL family transporter [Povalibacter sp.]